MGTYAGQGDYAEIVELEDDLDQEVDALRRAGSALAKREADYRKALAVKILEERAKGTPVTIISDLCRGDEQIADLKLLRDSAEAIYKASQEAINVKKLRVRTVSAQIDREWSRPFVGQGA